MNTHYHSLPCEKKSSAESYGSAGSAGSVEFDNFVESSTSSEVVIEATGTWYTGVVAGFREIVATCASSAVVIDPLNVELNLSWRTTVKGVVWKVTAATHWWVVLGIKLIDKFTLAGLPARVPMMRLEQLGQDELVILWGRLKAKILT